MTGEQTSSLSQLTAVPPFSPSAEKDRETSRRLAAEFQSWPPTVWPDRPIRAKPPLAREMLGTRILIVLATISLLAFMAWIILPSHIGDPVLYVGLTIAAFLRAICLLFEWYTYWAMTVPPEIQVKRKWTVDILTTACPGEPTGMIVRTLKSMVAIRHPHKNYLCDEGNDPYLKSICDRLGVIHVTRKEKKNAKAGNINNALKQATGQIAVVLDPDHDPAPYLLERTLGYFEDPAVGFVQSVQAYGNQSNSFVAKAAAQQSYDFYGPFMMGTNGHNTTQAIGANCVFRRAALDSIGGHAAGLAEDMHTAMRLYSKGWRSVYVPEILTRGLTPTSLGAFYKQQVKWACGTFDLLFQKYPGLFRSFTLMQKLHYFLCPVFFLRGFIVLLEMVVPILCLTFGLVAWRAPFAEIIAWFLPMLVMATLLRLRVQRWFMEPHEPGMHSPAGILTTATWWIYIMGVVCAVLRIKIPYIPTPKEDKPTDAWLVALPNFMVAAVLLAAVVYGLHRDASPAAWFMAFLALINAAALFYVSLVSQQVTLQKIRHLVRPWRRAFLPLDQIALDLRTVYHRTLPLLRARWIFPGSVALATFLISFVLLFRPLDAWREAYLEQNHELDCGGFYTGLDLGVAGDGQLLDQLSNLEKQLDFHFGIVSLDQTWNPDDAFPAETLKELRRHGAVPLLNWLPTSHLRMLPPEHAILKSIADGKYDAYVRQFADQVRAFGEPLLISFAPRADDPQSPWSTSAGNSAADFVAAWRHVADLFATEGASNVGWVWIPAHPTNVAAYIPGRDGVGYIDWVGLSMAGHDPTEKTFAEQYELFRSQLHNYHLPIMLTDLRPVSQNGIGALSRGKWDIGLRYPEIKAVVFSAASRMGGLRPQPQGPRAPAAGSGEENEAQRLSSFRESLKAEPFRSGGARSLASNQPLWFDLHAPPRGPTPIAGGPGHFSLMVDGAPFYIKGVAYNPSSDWHDASMPLSRSEMDDDFSQMQKMGANTIRRYGESWSDRTLLDSAVDHHLKVLYGFWFMQDVDYVTDAETERAYQRQIETTVLKYRDHPGLLGWCLGNEVWGLLKHDYGQPYLTEVRHAHVLFVERMAQRIKALDPRHPIFCANEADQIAGAASDFALGAPSIDVMGYNSYYQLDISNLDRMALRFDPSRPYVVSEFGHDGYWNDSRNRYDRQSGLLEDTALTKARLDADRWREDIQAHMGRNLGGIAYCWIDRYGGTPTWFGLTDMEGRLKPAVAALQNAWQFPDPHLAGTFPYHGPRIVAIDYPTVPQWAHEPFLVRAAADAGANEHPRFLWSATDSSFKRVGQITPLGNGESARIELPSAGWYRIQVKVVGKAGLDEGNIPVRVQASGLNDLGIKVQVAANASAPHQ